jgi:outer membrane protein assembly factor BamB
LFGDDEAAFGQGPCVEHGDALYVFDEAVLTAFDLKTGTVRWRLPSVGTVGLLFDDKGMLYVNTTTASPERIKYSRQIDISRVTSGVILKINPRSGKILWAETSGSLVSCVSGKFIYTLSSHQADENEANAPYRTGLETPSHVTIRRLNPDNGRMMWQHYEQRAPIDVQFANTSIRIVFKKEVEVLKFLSF